MLDANFSRAPRQPCKSSANEDDEEGDNAAGDDDDGAPGAADEGEGNTDEQDKPAAKAKSEPLALLRCPRLLRLVVSRRTDEPRSQS